jgi:hypothetical protein
MAGLLVGGSRIETVADLRTLERVPYSNAVQRIPVREIDDPRVYPNVAILRFTEDHAPVRAAIARIRNRKEVVDLPALVLPWLGFLWGVGAHNNPLVEDKGLPSASLMDNAFAMAGIDLTPGLTSTAACPEAIWQAAKWWGSYYRDAGEAEATAGEAAPIQPTGRYWCRQPAAFVDELETPARPAAQRRQRRPRRPRSKP